MLLELDHVTKKFDIEGELNPVVKDITFTVSKGNIVVLLGPTGCGKTTLLRIIAGILSPDSGKVIFKGKKIGFVSEHYGLFPWLTVRENIEFGLRAKSFSFQKKIAAATMLLDFIGLKKYENAYPHELSSGMQQRVAIARALAVRPNLLLFDDPYSSLDIHTRTSMQKFLLELQSKTGISVVFVTHSIEEALLLGDDIFILSFGPAKIVKHIHNCMKGLDPMSQSFMEQEQMIMKIMKKTLVVE